MSDENRIYDNGGWIPTGWVAMDHPEPVISTPTGIATYQQYIREPYQKEEK